MKLKGVKFIEYKDPITKLITYEIIFSWDNDSHTVMILEEKLSPEDVCEILDVAKAVTKEEVKKEEKNNVI